MSQVLETRKGRDVLQRRTGGSCTLSSFGFLPLPVCAIKDAGSSHRGGGKGWGDRALVLEDEPAARPMLESLDG
jgi:hypothetical protein